MKYFRNTLFRKRRSARSAFSLVEITIALGIIAFALVGIMGLLPVAMRAANESQWETRATFIAESIIGELNTADPANAFIAIDETDPANWTSGPTRYDIDLTADGTYYVLYDDKGTPLRREASNTVTATSDTAAYIAQVTVQKQAAPLTNLSRISVEVAVPASAPTNRRTTYPFVTLLKNTQ